MTAESLIGLIEEMVDLKIQQYAESTMKPTPEIARILHEKKQNRPPQAGANQGGTGEVSADLKESSASGVSLRLGSPAAFCLPATPGSISMGG